MASVSGTPVEHLRSLRVPDAVAEEFVACFLALPGVDSFAPNARRADSQAQLLRFGNAAALALLVLLRRHAPAVLDELWRVEGELKGYGGCVRESAHASEAAATSPTASHSHPGGTPRTCGWRTCTSAHFVQAPRFLRRTTPPSNQLPTPHDRACRSCCCLPSTACLALRRLSFTGRRQGCRSITTCPSHRTPAPARACRGGSLSRCTPKICTQAASTATSRSLPSACPPATLRNPSAF